MISAAAAPRFLYMVNLLKYMMFCIPVLMLYYGYKGVSIGDFFLIQGIAWLAVFVFEIPSGYASDVFSRKKNLCFGFITSIIGHLCWVLGSEFWALLIGELFLALAFSFFSGTSEAYLYDLLKRRRKEHQFHKKMAKMTTLSNLGLMIATLTGAFFYQFLGRESVVWLEILAVGMALFITLLLPDVPESRRKIAADKSKWQDICDISKFAVKHSEIKWLILFPAIYGTLTLILMWGLQSVMIATHIPVIMFSVMVGLNAFGRTAWSAVSGILLEKYGLNNLILFLCVLVSVAVVAASVAVFVSPILVYVCLILMIAGSASIQLLSVTTSTLVNHRIQSDERATVLSVKSMISRLCGGLAMIGLKPLFDSVGVSETFMISAILLIPIFWSASHLFKINLSIGGKNAAS